MNAIIHERGNGLPDVGDYVSGDDGDLYEVVALTDSIQTGRSPGEGNWVRARVSLADWRDIGDDDEPLCSCSCSPEDEGDLERY